MMDEIVFEPKYEYGDNFWRWVAFLIVIGSQVIAGDAGIRIIFSFILLICLLVYWFLHIRQFRFQSDSFLIERLFLPPKAILYSDVLEVGAENITILGWSKIYLGTMSNRDELRSLMRRFVHHQGPQTEDANMEYHQESRRHRRRAKLEHREEYIWHNQQYEDEKVANREEYNRNILRFAATVILVLLFVGYLISLNWNTTP